MCPSRAQEARTGAAVEEISAWGLVRDFEVVSPSVENPAAWGGESWGLAQ
jgi:hypothetical protein